jgi:hypothetical protein
VSGEFDDLEWSQPFGSGSGRWSADTRVDGLDVEITVNGIHPDPHCPCHPDECRQPGVPYATVYAVSWVQVLASFDAFGRHYLTSAAGSFHTVEPLARPGTVANAVAAVLAGEVAGTGRAALSEIARHAERIGAVPA